MPRKGRGGERQGTPGTAYGNRSDLNMPISTVPGQDYGKASAQQAAQSAVPMGQSPVSNLQQAPAMPTPQAAPLPQPGSMPWLHPTNRPNEPVTAGLPFGPGASAPEPSRDVISSALSSIARTASSSSAVSELAATAKSMGL